MPEVRREDMTPTHTLPNHVPQRTRPLHRCHHRGVPKAGSLSLEVSVHWPWGRVSVAGDRAAACPARRRENKRLEQTLRIVK